MNSATRLVSTLLLGLLTPAGLAASPWMQGHGDSPQDGPSRDSIRPVSTPTLSSGGSNTVTFRTDQGPDLDLYQPCSGGDNTIAFGIDVQGVTLAAISKATLTLAVWDVDFACGGTCCERDPVFLNGTGLTTPSPFLTGANGQWSTVSFDVDPSLIALGTNQVRIDIDVLCLTSWCVECDWGQLTLELEDTPEIKEIKVSPENPETLEDVMFEAELENMTGYDVVELAWSGDIKPGTGNPYKTKPAAGTHGKKSVTATLRYKPSGGGAEETVSKSMDFKLFFKKKGDDDNNGEPNWFKYWKSDSALSSLSGVSYKKDLPGYGRTVGSTVYIGPKGADQHYSKALKLSTHFGSESFGGPSVKGIDCAAEVVAHEKYHAWVNTQWNSGGSFHGQTDSDKGVPMGDENDKLPDSYESATSHTKTDDTDTYDLEHKKAKGYRRYGDNEYMAMRSGDGLTGVAEKDWANPGKQSTPAYLTAGDVQNAGASDVQGGTQILDGPIEGLFTGNDSEFTVDEDNDGLFDSLVIQLELDVVGTGEFHYVGFLSDGHSIDLGLINEAEALLLGQQFLEFSFAGSELWRSGQDGPYELSVQLTDDHGEHLDETSYTTQLYTASQFEALPQLTGSYAESTPDDNGNNLFDALEVAVSVDPSVPGELIVDGFLYDPLGNPVSYASSEVTVEAAGSQIVPLRFPGPDIRRSRANGLFTLRSVGVLLDGARADYSYMAYETSALSYAQFEPASGELLPSTSFADQGLDLNGNGFYEVLRVNLMVEAFTAGSYSVLATLAGPQGEPLDDVTVDVVLPPGVHDIPLDFSGEAIWRSAEDGPYQLRSLFLFGAEGEPADSLQLPYETSAYGYLEFEPAPVAFTGVSSDQAVDQNGDGTYEALLVDIEVIADTAGFFALNARLLDALGSEIVWASTSMNLPANQPMVMQLSFPGAAIDAHGVAGPFEVRDAYVYNTSNAGLSDYLSLVRTTEDHWDLGNLPPVASAGPDQIVPQSSIVGAEVTLDGSASFDPNGDPLNYEWTWPGGAASGVTPSVVLPPGTTVVTLTIFDGISYDTDDSRITVEDQTPRILSCFGISRLEIYPHVGIHSAFVDGTLRSDSTFTVNNPIDPTSQTITVEIVNPGNGATMSWTAPPGGFQIMGPSEDLRYEYATQSFPGSGYRVELDFLECTFSLVTKSGINVSGFNGSNLLVRLSTSDSGLGEESVPVEWDGWGPPATIHLDTHLEYHAPQTPDCCGN